MLPLSYFFGIYRISLTAYTVTKALSSTLRIKSISFLYLPKDSNKTIYVDGKQTQKEPVTIGEHEFYICYAISKRDTFLSMIVPCLRYYFFLTSLMITVSSA